MKVYADPGRCVGVANCVMTVPDVFSIDDDDTVMAMEGSVAAQHWAAVEDAVLNCPTGALRIERD